jgi:hypothetical protein
MMWDGKKNTAQKIFYGAWTRSRSAPPTIRLKLFKKAVENAKPLLEVKTRRVGGANYQVPVEVPQNRRVSLAIRWILHERPQPARKGHAGQAGQRVERRRQHARRSDQEEGRRSPHGGSEQGFRALSLVTVHFVGFYGTHCTDRKMRNIGIMAHIDAGKTTTTERILYYTGVRTRSAKFMKAPPHGLDGAGAGARHHDHVRRHHVPVARHHHQHHRHARPRGFHGRSGAQLRVLDGAVAVFDAVAGVQPQSETVWRQADKYGVPRICFINKMDRVGADFYHSIDTIVDRLKCRPVAIQIPVGAEDQFKGIVDLVTMKARIWRDETLGASSTIVEIPADLLERPSLSRADDRSHRRIDDHLFEKFVEGTPISEPRSWRASAKPPSRRRFSR